MRLEGSVGRAIRTHRKRAGLTQAALAEAAGLTEQYVGVVERGAAMPTLKTLEALSNALKTPVRDFFPGAVAQYQRDDALREAVELLEPLSDDERARALKILRSVFGQD